MNAEQVLLLQETEFRFYVLQIGETRMSELLRQLGLTDPRTFKAAQVYKTTNAAVRVYLRSNNFKE